MKPDSNTTPCRIVFNSSARFQGFARNDYLAKGPSLLNQLLGILLRFRVGRIAFIGDISKMFHAIDIPIEDQITHLFLWRGFNTHKQPDTYAITVVNMGDRPSTAIAQIALRKTAEEVAKEFSEASKIIVKNSYMDDIPASVNTMENAQRIMKEIEMILKKKCFQIKGWTCSGPEAKICDSEDQRTNAYEYYTKRNILSCVNICPLRVVVTFHSKGEGNIT